MAFWNDKTVCQEIFDATPTLGKETEAYQVTIFPLFSSKPPDSGQSVGVFSLCMLLSDLALYVSLS